MKFRHTQTGITSLKKAAIGTLTVFTLLSGPKVLSDGPYGLDNGKSNPASKKTETAASKNEKTDTATGILAFSIIVGAIELGVWKIEQHTDKEMREAEAQHQRNMR